MTLILSCLAAWGLYQAIDAQCPTKEAQGCTLPTSHFTQPPQYIPPSPAYPLTRELASMESLPCARPTCTLPGAPVVTAACTSECSKGSTSSGCCTTAKAACCSPAKVKAATSNSCCTATQASCCSLEKGKCCAETKEACCPCCSNKEGSCCGKSSCCADKQGCCSNCCSKKEGPCCGKTACCACEKGGKDKVTALQAEVKKQQKQIKKLHVALQRLHQEKDTVPGVAAVYPPLPLPWMGMMPPTPMMWSLPGQPIGVPSAPAGFAVPPPYAPPATVAGQVTSYPQQTWQAPAPIVPPHLFSVPPTPQRPRSSHAEWRMFLGKLFNWLPGCQSQACGTIVPASASMDHPPQFAPAMIPSSPQVGPMPQMLQCSATELARPASVDTWSVRTIEEGGHSVLEVRNSSDTSATCESMVLKVPGAMHLKVHAGEGQVQVSDVWLKDCARVAVWTEGALPKLPCLEGCADRLTKTNAGNQVILEGHVRLKFKRGLERGDVSAERVVVDLRDGRLEITPVTNLYRVR